MAARAKSDDLWQSYKRQSIQQAVIQLMCREGLHSVTMDRVAQEAGIAKGTIYLHYRDKQELLEDVKNSSLEPMVEKMEDIFRSDAAADRKLQTYSIRYLNYFDERRDLFRILLYEREVVRVQGARYQGDRRRRLVEGAARVIREGIAQGVFRDIDPDNVAAMFVDSNLSMLKLRLLTDSAL
ncbi:MAG TPA: TetR/AcrR family transcriptional regulator, partial [Thermoanaerobaculia bacterium]|nr:TetR/AcrR family transcriptional regulator [Thermoanaerobaculia bacterium]